MYVLALRVGYSRTIMDGDEDRDDDDVDDDAELEANEAEELDRDIETLEVRLSLAENGIEEAMAVLGLKTSEPGPADVDVPKPVKRTSRGCILPVGCALCYLLAVVFAVLMPL